ncbi:16S rRNA (guanine(527)-N(7))-methyltransferase RsmG [Sphingomonas sp.]|uniref:16S rRNA (guanine(527)-N(7))-methyltransferase RsmG n=1 Tax=Sphingomonas sp. TaxID=28214 RepID=UPI002CBF09FE|nr:16S rRNA (guanine(527)-N(7))-methyltransferase RsmG [Sphingomonas sp.]HTG38504.1 16S rRNA (guanine(527)-N(7))-methyltransferase RsmG [Sphingomonas sp.]
MIEAQAQQWLQARWGSACIDKLTIFVRLLIEEAGRQNLVSRSTLDAVWERHILDSAQLVPLADAVANQGRWIDIGSGAGLPGIVAAILQARPVLLIEPRRKRVAFLDHVIEVLKLNATTQPVKAESVSLEQPASVISARAVANLNGLFSAGAGFSDRESLWLLPKGRSADFELAEVRGTWQGVFHVEQSLTATDSRIIIAKKVQRR